MKETDPGLLAEVAEYYSSRIARYGNTPQGVDWNGHEGQILRFEQLSKVINSTQTFTVNDLGCGYGAFLDFLEERYPSFSYTGIDLSGDMIKSAKQRFIANASARFLVSHSPDQTADYSIASGIFNVRLGIDDSSWQAYIEQTLDILDRTSRIGFSFNCLTAYSDPEKKRDYLYYADPCFLFDRCKRLYSRNVAVLHDYDLFEFTILVRKKQ